MENPMCTALFIILTLLLIFNYIIYKTIAMSPQIGFQEHDDSTDHLFDITTRKVIMTHDNSNIRFVTYSSDGKYLNSTIWLDPKLKNSSNEVIYGMFIDVDSNNSTGFNGASYLPSNSPAVSGTDYIVQILGRNDSSTNKLMQLSEINRMGLTRILYNKSVNIDFRQGYIPLDIDLQKIGYPNDYHVKFFTKDIVKSNNVSTVMIVDDTMWQSVPAPKFELTLLPNSLVLNPGEQKIVGLRLTSNSSLPFTAFLHTIETFGIKSMIRPNVTIITPRIPHLSVLLIRASDNATEGTYVVPIKVTIFPRMEFGFILPLLSIENNLGIKVHRTTLDESVTNSLAVSAEVLRDNKELVLLMIGAFITPFAAILVNNLIRKKPKK